MDSTEKKPAASEAAVNQKLKGTPGKDCEGRDGHLWELNYSRYHKLAADYLKAPDAPLNLVKDARKMAREMERIEKNNTDLFSLVRSVEKEAGANGEGDSPLPDYMLSMDLPGPDRRALEKYIRDWELLHLLKVALETETKAKYRPMLEDIFFSGLKEKEISAKHGVTVRTVGRTKKKGVEAVERALRRRKATLPELF